MGIEDINFEFGEPKELENIPEVFRTLEQQAEDKRFNERVRKARGSNLGYYVILAVILTFLGSKIPRIYNSWQMQKRHEERRQEIMEEQKESWRQLEKDMYYKHGIRPSLDVMREIYKEEQKKNADYKRGKSN